MKLNVDVSKGVVVKSFAWKLSERLLSQGINLVVQIILARLLLPETFGSLAIIVAITNYASIFVQSGLATAIIQKEGLDELDISTLLTASVFIAAVFYVLLYIAAPFIATYYNLSELKWTLRALAFILILNAVNSVQTAILSRRMEFKKLFFRTLLATLISGSAGIIMAYKGFGIWALVAHNLINMLVIVIYMSFDKDLRISPGFSLSRAKSMYRFSGKILLTSIITGFHDMLRTMVIGKKYSSGDLAYYDKAYTYSGYVTQVVNTSMQSVLLSAFSRKQEDIDTLRQMARRSVKLSAFVMFPVLIGFAVLCKNIVPLLLTPKWNPCIPYLMLFSLLRIPGVTMSVDKQVYYALGRSGINLFYEIGLFIFNIITLLITVQISTMAIAVGATAAEFLGGIAILLVSAKVYGYTLYERLQDLLRPMVSSLIMAACAWSTELLNLGNLPTLLIKSVVCFFVYISIAAVTKDDNLKYITAVLKERVHGKKGENV